MIRLKQLLFEMYNVSTQPIWFVRYGGLSPVRQKGFKKSSTFHAPPAKKGIYAFVWPFIDKFLLGGGYGDPGVKDANNRMKYIRDKEGNVIDSNHPDYEKVVEKHPKYWAIDKEKVKEKDEDGEEHERTTRWALAQHVKPKKFKYEGDIWHHLERTVPMGKIIDKKGDWVKTDFKTYREALSKELHQMDVDILKNPSLRGSRTHNPAFFSTKDHLEVFIERL